MKSNVHQMLYSKVRNIDFLESSKHLTMFQPAEIAPWKPKSPPKSRKSQIAPITHEIAPWGGDFAHVEDHWFIERFLLEFHHPL